MGLGTTIGYFALRAVAAACTGGLSEGAFIAGDIVGVAFAAADVASSINDLASSGADFASTVNSALEDGKITKDEAAELLAAGGKFAVDAHGVAEAAEGLKDELKAMGSKKLSGKEVVAVGKHLSHCSVCNMPGVNKRSHKPGHKMAHKHKF